MRNLKFMAIATLLVCGALNLESAVEPANPDMTKEARALLDLFHRITGKYTLTGQHNYPATKDRNSKFTKKYMGYTPAVWSTDMGFAEEGDTDSYLARPDIVKQAIRQHQKGSIVTICWHAVPPTADEPVTFQPRRDQPAPPDALASVQGQLLDEQYKELLTPGTRLHKRWLRQVDSVAVYLKQLQDAKVPVLWRPYHEMNGDWFWWGGRVGEYSTIDIYKMLYDRYVNYHKLNNLVWVWSVDRPATPIRQFRNFYPGTDYLDILSLDVYGSDFNQDYYDSLMVLSNGKPLVLGEVGNPPSTEILDTQPNWSYWVIWAGMVRLTSKEEYANFVKDPRLLFQEDEAYHEVMAPFRKACQLPVLPLESKYPVDFSGEWILNEEKSQSAGRGGMGGSSAYKMVVDHDEDVLYIKRYAVVEWGDDQITNDEIWLDGSEMRSVSFNFPRISTAQWNEKSRSVVITTTMKFNRGGQSTEMKSSEEWKLENNGKRLKIIQTSPGFRDDSERTVTQVYEKEN